MQPAQDQACRVLVIEDDIDEADSLRDVLELAGYSAEVAYTGMEGLSRARLMHPDVVVCDLGLPDIDGFEVARSLRADPDLSGSYMVALTGHVEPKDVERTASAGYDVHMAKPADPAQITRLIDQRSHAGR